MMMMMMMTMVMMMIDCFVLLTHLFLVFEDCGIGEAGACAVAERLLVGLTALALVFGGCGMELYGTDFSADAIYEYYTSLKVTVKKRSR